MKFDIGGLRLDLLDDGLFELRPETFVKISRGHSSELLDKTRFRPRIKVGFNSLLVRGGDKTVLIDPGTGDKERAAQRRNYNLDWPRRVLSQLKELGVRREQVDTVVLTHLHWDHAGACTTVGHGGQLEPTFPKARYVLQRRELQGARDGVAAGDDGYAPEDFEPLVSMGRLDLIDEEDLQILPWLSVHWSGGHSPGHQVVRIGPEGGKRVMYFSDVLPTTAQLSLESGMSYDQNPEELRQAKLKFMTQAAKEMDVVVLVHAPRNRVGHLREIAPGEFKFQHITL